LVSKKGFTSRAKDWELKYFETFLSRTEAVRREMAIKKWKSRKMIEKLIRKE
jgi:putative endonuclease